jgi:hypothetical protein
MTVTATLKVGNERPSIGRGSALEVPLIESRPLTITVASFGEGQIRVNVVPQAGSYTLVLPDDDR